MDGSVKVIDRRNGKELQVALETKRAFGDRSTLHCCSEDQQLWNGLRSSSARACSKRASTNSDRVGFERMCEF